MIKLTTIKSNPDNPRLIKDEKFHKLCESLKSFGKKMMPLRPIVVDENNIILGGNMRFKALKEIGYKEVPDDWIKRADDLSEDQKREFIIKDNVGFGEWDFDILSNEWDVDQLEQWGMDIPIQEIEDYSTKNKEIDIDSFEDEMILKLKYKSDDYYEVKESLSRISSTPEHAILKLLKLDYE